jgi:hypothetical protein
MKPAWFQASHVSVRGASISRPCRAGTAQTELSDRLEQADSGFCGPGAETEGMQGACRVRTFGDQFFAAALAEKACLADGLDRADPFWGHTFLVCCDRENNEPSCSVCRCKDLVKRGSQPPVRGFFPFNHPIFLVFSLRGFTFFCKRLLRISF